jgi:4-hydroxy-4-methyl-2-oxoglutarate aldolase
MDDKDIASVLAELGAATLGESGGLSMPPRIRPVWPGAAVAAKAYPVSCTPGDNLAIHVAVTQAPAGSVVVVDVGEVAQRGYWGEVLTTGAQSRGLAGLVIDGGVRDVAALERLGFPVFSSMIALRGATKLNPGTAGIPATVATVPVELGDWVVGDVDGVVVIRDAQLDETIAAGRARVAAESKYLAALRSGSTTVEQLGLDASLIKVGAAGPQ